MSDLERRVAELERLMRGVDATRVASTPNLRVQTTLDLLEKSSTPATPPYDYGRMYAGTTAPWWISDSGSRLGMFIDHQWMPGETAYPYGTGAGTLGDTYYFPGITLNATDQGSATWMSSFRSMWAGLALWGTAYWVSDSTNTGNVRLAIDVRQATDGTNLSSGTSYLGNVSSVASPGQYILKVTSYSLGTLQSWTGGQVMMCGVRRDGNDALDTHTGTIRVLGLLLYPR